MRVWIARRRQRPSIAQGLEARRIVVAGGLLERLHGRMEELVDEAARERFDGCDLFGAQGAKACLDAAQFRLADLFGLALQGDDGRGDVDGALTLVESLYLRGDERLGIGGLGAAFSHVRCGDGLQVVDVVDEDSVDLIHRRLDIARDSNINEENGPVATALHEGLSVFTAENGVRRAGRGNDDVGFGCRFVKLVEGNDAAFEGLSQLTCSFEGAVGHEYGSGSLLDEVARGQLTHFAGADEEDGAAVARAENLAGKLDGHPGYGNGIGADGGFGADALGGGEGALQEMFKLAGDGAAGTSDGKCFFDLAENLRLADHH